MKEVMKRYRVALTPGMGALMTAAAVIGPEAVANLFPEPKPPKELTDDDHRRLQVAEERRKRRAAKWVGRV